MASSSQTVHLIDFYPERGMYRPGEEVRLFLECEASAAGQYSFVLQVFHGVDLLAIYTKEKKLDMGHNRLEFHWLPSSNAPAGYGVELSLEETSNESEKIETAFDILSDWTSFPRYGFVCDFSRSREEEGETVQILAKYHINGLQFYDWQYRHDDLVPPQDDYLDPLGRPLSLNTTKKLITAAHAHGMAAMPYLAIYAASAAFWKAHPDWMLYDTEKRPIPFGENFLGIMNPVAGGPWQRHLLEQCKKVLKSLPFDGLHTDQYGEPKTGFDQNMQVVDLPNAFGDFVRTAVHQHQKPVLFNAVGNWPIETLAASPTAFNYIEVWPPDVHYVDLVRIVRNARQLSGEKPVVIALYLPAAREINNQLADALIFSAGGTRIELGENGRLLSDPYFPKHEPISEELNKALRKQDDLLVRYGEWFGPLVHESPVLGIKAPAGIEIFFRKTQKGSSLSLVNLKGETPFCWNEEHTNPEAFKDFEVEVEIDQPVKKVWLVSPDRPSVSPLALEFMMIGNLVTVKVPELRVWDVLLFEVE